MLDGFAWIIFLLPLIGAIAGYFFRVRLQRNQRSKSAELGEYKRRVQELEASLQECQKNSLAYQNEIISIQPKLQIAIGSQSEIASSDNEANNNQDNNVPIDGSSDESVAASLVKGSPADQEQKERSSKRSSKFEALKNDNLQIVEGIGPKMESVLKENGVKSWSQLGDHTEDTLRVILEKYGNKYKIIDPVSWPEQAQHAANSNWSQLVRMQKGLDVGRDSSLGDTPAKIEKVMVKLGILKMYKQDDLKAIEGIGPKIAELLNTEGINLWKHLAKASIEDLQNILDKAGKRYQLADPCSWPKQAALADEGNFDELSDYQDILQGGV